MARAGFSLEGELEADGLEPLATALLARVAAAHVAIEVAHLGCDRVAAHAARVRAGLPSSAAADATLLEGVEWRVVTPLRRVANARSRPHRGTDAEGMPVGRYDL